MKRIEISVEEDDAGNIEEVLNTEQMTFSKFSSSSEIGNIYFYSTTVADEQLDSALEKLSSAMDMRKSDNQIIVLDVLAYVSTKLRNVQKRATEKKSKNPIELIVQPLDQHLKLTRYPAIMVILSTIVVLVGLFLENVPIIIGSMLLSPLLGPASASMVNGSLGRTKQLLKSEWVLFMLVGISLALSAIISFIIAHVTSITPGPQIVSRTSISGLDIIVAIVLGFAAALALTTKLPETLVGVAIAAALLPPLGVAGIYLGLGNFHDFLNAFLLTMIYIFGLKVGGIAFLRASGITPRKYYEKQKARSFSLLSFVVFTIILGILIVLAYI